MESSSAPQTSKFPTMEQELFIPPAKRLCLEIPGGYANNSSHQGWWHFGATRRSSLAHFMEPGASPVKLDIKIDRGIFDSNPLESPLVTDGEKEYTHVSQQETPTTFSPHGLMSPHGASKQYLTSSSSTSSTDAIIHATREIHEQIEEDPYRRFSAGEKMDGSNDAEARFRAHQSEGWMEKYEELVLYQEKNGDCLVPNQYPENPSLAEWVKRQRYQYKLRQNGQHSSMCDERINALSALGFCWNAHDACWAQRYIELKHYKNRYGHADVPSNCNVNPKLAVWVKRQRRQYKFLIEGKPSTLTPYRTEKLLELGFSWSGRKPKSEFN